MSRKGFKVLSVVYWKEVAKILKWHTFSNSGFDENDSNHPFQIDKKDGCKNILKYIQMNNRNN